jgi:hypothetical protein
VGQFDKEASQARGSCVANNATLRAARPDPSLRKRGSFRMTSRLENQKLKTPFPPRTRPRMGRSTDELAIQNLRFVRRQIAGLFDQAEVDSPGREFSDFGAPIASACFDVEHLRAEHAADRAFIHG